MQTVIGRRVVVHIASREKWSVDLALLDGETGKVTDQREGEVYVKFDSPVRKFRIRRERRPLWGAWVRTCNVAVACISGLPASPKPC
jgi:hypothetical protein